MEKKPSFGICTLGCRVNQYESEAIAKKLCENGFVQQDFSEFNDIYIINTCTVTGESDRKSGQMVRRAIRKNEKAAILVCGCSSQMFPQRIASIKNVDYVGGSKNKLLVAEKAMELYKNGKNQTPEINVAQDGGFEKMEASFQDRARAFLKIEDGCNNKCSYCIIPHSRGRVCSKNPDELFDEVKMLVKNGYSEVVLVGIETAAYGEGEGYSLITLLEKLEEIDGLERIRLGSIEPAYLKKNIIDRLSVLKKPMPHYHLSLQSGCDNVLRAMRRRNNTKMALESIEYMREKIPNVTFGADIIVGFPKETEEDFEETKKFIGKAGILNCHVFAYSRRPDTEADRMNDQINEEIKEKRSRELRDICLEKKKEIINSYIEKGTVLGMLTEIEKDGYLYGHTDNFIEVRIKKTPCVECHQKIDVVLKEYCEKTEKTTAEII